MLVGYQGEPGAFSEQAVLDLFPGANTKGFTTFDDLIEAASAGSIDLALLPIENSIYGAIARSYDLLWQHRDLTIIDETRARIVQTLIGIPGTSLDQIVEVRSHPVALEQCRTFLARHSAWRRRSVDDTAGAVREIMSAGDRTIAAIGPARAAALYGGCVIASAIQDDPENFTRFFLIERARTRESGSGRACLAMTLPDRIGSLRDALDAFAEAGINLRLLVSRPSGDGPFLYRFYCEIENSSRGSIENAAAKLDGSMHILGLY